MPLGLGVTHLQRPERLSSAFEIVELSLAIQDHEAGFSTRTRGLAHPSTRAQTRHLVKGASLLPGYASEPGRDPDAEMRRTPAVQSTCQRPAPIPRVPTEPPALTGVRWVRALHGHTPALAHLPASEQRRSLPTSGAKYRTSDSPSPIGQTRPSGRGALGTIDRGCFCRGFVKSHGVPSPKNLPPPRSLSALYRACTDMTRTGATLGVVSLVQASPDRASARPHRQPQPPRHSHAQRRS